MTLRVVEGNVQVKGTVSGTDSSTIGLHPQNNAQRIWVDNPMFVLATGIAVFEGAGSVGVTVEGATVTISGQEGASAGVSSINTLQGPLTFSGGNGLNLTVDGQVFNFEGFESEFLAASGSLQNQINSIDVDEIEPAIVGTDGITVISGTNTITVEGFRGEFLAASGSLSSEIDSDILAHAGDSSAHHIRYSDAESVFATEASRFTLSGTLSAEIDSDIAFHTMDAGAHHIRYTDQEAIAATEGSRVTLSGHLQSQVGSNSSNITELQASGIALSSDIASLQQEDLTFVKIDGSTPITGDQTIQGTLTTTDETVLDQSTIGPVGTEGTGFNLNGLIFESSLKVSDIGGSRAAILQLHRHSTTVEPILLSTRTNSDTASHLPVTTGQSLLNIMAAGWGGTNYKPGGRIDFDVDTGTVSPSSMPTRIDFRINGDGESVLIPPIAMSVRRAGVEVNGTGTFTGQVEANSGLTVSGIPVNLVAPDVFLSDVVTISGHLQAGINSINVDEIEPAIVGSDGITVVSGTNTEIQGFRGEFLAASGIFQAAINNNLNEITTSSGFLQSEIDTNSSDIISLQQEDVSLQNQINAINVDEIENALVGTNGITVISGSSFDTIQGFRPEFINTSGSLQSQIDNINIDEPEPAILGTDGITIISGSNAITVQGFRSEFLSASGTLSSEIDSDIVLHTNDANAHHTRYTDSESITALEPITSELLASGTENTNLIITISGSLQGQLDSHTSNTSIHFTESSINHGNLLGLSVDDHSQYALLAGRGTGQTLIGGVNAGNNLELRGSPQSGTSRGNVVIRGRISMLDGLDAAVLSSSRIPQILSEQNLVTPGSGTFVPSFMNIQDTWAVNTNVFIYSGMQVNLRLNQNIAPLFSAFTLFLASPTISTNVASSMGGIILQGAPVYNHAASGASSFGDAITVDSRPLFRTVESTNGVLNTATVDSVLARVQRDTPAGTTINFGRISGLRVEPLSAGGDGNTAGTVNFSEFYGLFFNDAMGAVNPSVRSASVYSITRSGFANQRGILTTGTSTVRAAKNEFIGGGTTVMHGLALPARTDAEDAVGDGRFTIFSNQANWEIPGFNSLTTINPRGWLRVEPTVNNAQIQGINSTFAEMGQVIIITNVSTTLNLIIANENISAVASRRIISPTGADYTLAPNQTATLMYDTSTARWRIIEFSEILGLKDTESGFFFTTVTGSVTLVQSAKHRFDINNFTAQTEAGSVSGTLQINGVPVTGIDNQVWGTTETTSTATANNNVNSGDKVTLEIDASSNFSRMGWSYEVERVV